jgi:hypothetical protein
MREQFAGWGMYDNVAVCMECRHQHLIPKSEQISEQPWLDWVHKHAEHTTFILPQSALTKLGAQVASFAHNANVKVAYAASAAYTFAIASLATDANLLAGYESTGLSNTGNLYLDILVGGKVTSGTSPTTATQIEIHCIGAVNDTPLYPDVFTGVTGTKTITAAEVKQSLVAPICILPVNASSNISYWTKPVGIRQLFGDGLPSAHSLFAVHNTGVALNATAGNHAWYNTPVYATVI